MRLNNQDFMIGLIDLCKDLPQIEKMIEVGSYAGESTLIFKKWLAPELIYCVDMWGVTDKYTNSEISKAEFIFDNLVLNSGIKKIKSHSRDISLKFPKVDFIYIDASHKYEDVSADIDFYLPFLKKGGYIGGHDYSDKFQGVKKAVDERFKNFRTYKDTSWLAKV